MRRVLTITFVSVVLVSRGDVIQSSNRIDWIPGVTLGVRQQYAERTNIIDVSSPPYSADKTGATLSTTNIQGAIDAAPANSVIFFPAGNYLTKTLYVQRSDITLRGELTLSNTPAASLIGFTNETPSILNIGFGENHGAYFTITNGATKGSTNLTIDASTSGVQGGIAAGDLVYISEDNGWDPEMNVISTGNYNHMLGQHAVVSTVSGGAITIRSPLVHTFTRNPKIKILGFRGRSGVGLENLKLTGTNELDNTVSSAQNLLNVTMVYDSWIRNCEFLFAKNYNVTMVSVANVEISHSKLHRSNGTGSNHAGLLFGASSCYIFDNILVDGLQPAIECNSGSGSAFFGNFISNNVLGINFHGAHPYMNLWEANVCKDVIIDGYFGSVSRQTFFRNHFDATYTTMTFRRWTTFIQLVGNVLGVANNTYPYYINEVDSTDAGIFSWGKPNIGNPNYVGTNPPVPWNYPGGTLHIYNGPEWPNGAFVFTNAPAYATNRIDMSMGLGTLTNLPNPYGSFYPIIFQDGTDTNKYWPVSDELLTTIANADSGGGANGYPAITNGYVELNQSIWFTNGWRIFVSGQFNYQQLQQSNRFTHTIHGNWDYFHTNVIWDSGIADTNLPVSLVSASTPSWWGTLAYPAVGPDLTPMRSTIPAESRYFGIEYEGPNTNPPTMIIVSPSTNTVETNILASFSAAFSGSTSNLWYQWRTNGVSFANATNSTFSFTSPVITSIPVAVVITNQFGSATGGPSTAVFTAGSETGGGAPITDGGVQLINVGTLRIGP